MSEPKVVISIVNWNGAEDTRRCLQSIQRLDYPAFETVVVDNGSPDGSVRALREEFPEVAVIENGRNLGFTGGQNRGIQFALERGADFVWLLNNDTWVDPAALRRLVEVAQDDPRVGLVSSEIRFRDARDTVQFAGASIDLRTLKIRYPEVSAGDIDSKYQVGEYVCLWGTSLLMRCDLIRSIGLLNDEYFAYWEDTEYSVRSLQAGFRNVMCGRSIVYHAHAAVAEDGQRPPHFYFYIVRNKWLFNSRFLRGLEKYRFVREYCAYVLGLLSWACDTQGGQAALAHAVVNGAWNGIRGRGGPMEQAERAPAAFRRAAVALARYPRYFWSYLLRGEFRELALRSTGRVARFGGRLKDRLFSSHSVKG